MTVLTMARTWLHACTLLVAGTVVSGISPPMSSQALANDKITIGQTFVASGLDPADGSTGWALVTHGIAEQLFNVSKEGEVVPNLATSATGNDDGSWTVELSPDRFFSDGTPVSADLVAKALNRTGAANPSARATAGRLTFEVIDEDTLRVLTEQPTTILPSILAEWAFPVYLETDTAPIFTGPFAVEQFTAGTTIEMVPNSFYDEADKRSNVTIRRIADGQSLALAFASGEIDLAFNLPVESISMFDGDSNKVVKSFPVGYQYMMWMNTKTPALSDVRVRQAINLAIKRDDLVAAARAGIPATGAFAQNYPFAADKVLPHEPDQAVALLDEAGWMLGADGVRIKGGKPLEVVLWAYPQRPDLITFQPVIRAALTNLGFSVKTQVTESPTDVAKKGEYDLFLWALHTAPAGDPGLFLSLFLETDSANNYAHWSDTDYDAIVAKLRSEDSPLGRIDLAKQAQEILAREAPVSFLITPEWHVGISEKLATYEPWGSDYYVVRPDLMVSQ